ncbi:MAG: helix-turn-helix domain-containing protein [Actinomycetota bacterium]|nr:helix-turn-helix domain-containing protein [Actinomycetota bacterium]
MARRRSTITLTDPRALRALAHPARQRLVSELFSGRVLTATEAAALVELTPSAVSHHLRVLEKWGLAKRTADSQDGRERPWAGAARSLNIESSEGAGSAAAISSILAIEMRAAERDLERFRGAGPDPWESAYRGLSRGRLWLTQDEARELSETLEAKIAEYAKGRSATRHPKGTRRASFTWSLVPVEPAPDDPA